MKKILLATTAVAAIALVSGDAYAQSSAAGPVKLGLGGYFQFYGVLGQQDADPGEPGEFKHNFDFKREAEIHFTGQTKLDNGLIAGVDVQLEAETCGDQIDESYIWFQGNWGRLNLGSENSAAYLLAVGAPAIDSAFDGQDPNYRLFNGAVAGSTIDAWVVDITGDSEKLTYLSPRIAGFRAGVSYTPDNSEEASAGQIAAKGGAFAGMPDNNDVGQWSNVISVGANYENKLGPVALLAGVGYEFGSLESGTPAGTLDDRQSWQAGADLGFAGFHFGGGYYQDDKGIDGDGNQDSWGVGLTYTAGPLTVGGSYFDSTQERDVLADEELKRIVVGARYAVGPGVDLRGSVQYYDYDAGTTANTNEAWFGVIGTVLTF